jgi:hypothetical protein
MLRYDLDGISEGRNLLNFLKEKELQVLEVGLREADLLCDVEVDDLRRVLFDLLLFREHQVGLNGNRAKLVEIRH